jgi:hypothetical protein
MISLKRFYADGYNGGVFPLESFIQLGTDRVPKTADDGRRTLV